jgi:hypothetical protein
MGATGKTALLAAACLVMGCRGKPSPTPGAPSSFDSAVAPSSAPPAAPVAPSSETWNESGIRKLVEQWVSAQNQVDFAAYERLYAPKFSGVKRVGSYAEWFGRKGWMRDRQAMFKPGLRVEATDLSVAFASSAARVRFTQSFSLGKFQDTGRKELIVVKGPDGPRIAREEMLVSKVSGAKPNGDGGIGGPGAHAVFEDSVYLGTGLGVDATTGNPMLSSIKFDPHFYTAEMTVDTQRLAPALRAWAGRTIEVMSVDGPVCKPKVRDFVVRASGQPHFGAVNEWRGLEGNPPASDAAIARDLWDMIPEDKRYLVARLDRKCPHAVAAFEHAAPVRMLPSTPSDAVKNVVLAALHTLPEYKDIQREFDKGAPKSPGPWDANAAESHLSEFSPSSGPAVVVASVTAGPYAGCGEFWGALSARFEVDKTGPSPRVTRTDVFETTDGVTAKVAFDANGDGSLDILTGPDGFNSNVFLWSAHPKQVEQLTLFAAAYMDCPC